MYDKILVATDGSEIATAAVEHAAALASSTGAKEVIILHVCPACTPELDPDGENRIKATEIVEAATGLMASKGLQARSLVEMDYPMEEIGEAIIDITAREEGDLLVIGSRGLSEFRGMLLGSVSHKVLKHGGCPVLIFRGSATDTGS